MLRIAIYNINLIALIYPHQVKLGTACDIKKIIGKLYELIPTF